MWYNLDYIVSRNFSGAVRSFCTYSIQVEQGSDAAVKQRELSRKEKADKAAADKQRKEKEAKAGNILVACFGGSIHEGSPKSSILS